jgi:hypothetical protein
MQFESCVDSMISIMRGDLKAPLFIYCAVV